MYWIRRHFQFFVSFDEIGWQNFRECKHDNSVDSMLERDARASSKSGCGSHWHLISVNLICASKRFSVCFSSLSVVDGVSVAATAEDARIYFITHIQSQATNKCSRTIFLLSAKCSSMKSSDLILCKLLTFQFTICEHDDCHVEYQTHSLPTQQCLSDANAHTCPARAMPFFHYPIFCTHMQETSFASRKTKNPAANATTIRTSRMEKVPPICMKIWENSSHACVCVCVRRNQHQCLRSVAVLCACVCVAVCEWPYGDKSVAVAIEKSASAAAPIRKSV